MKILGIESSCDETAAAVVEDGVNILSSVVSSQVEIHHPYGGVVPELASRKHIEMIVPVVSDALASAGLDATQVDAVALTQGPGLVGALLVGFCFGKSFAYALDIPWVGIDHLEGHINSVFLESPSPEFPYIALLASGGHTNLYYVTSHTQYELLGQSLDDAAGEAFDKTAKLLGLAYPGGPALAVMAQQGRHGVYKFPRPMVDRPGLDFSFSGLKTFALNTMQSAAHEDGAQGKLTQQVKADISLAFEEAVADTLKIKCSRALQQQQCKTLVIAGGVGANKRLRAVLAEMIDLLGGELFYPRVEFCTDNGAMIAQAGCFRLMAGETQPLEIDARARWSMQDLKAI